MNSTRRTYLTTAIPFVNGNPHLGHAVELVQPDVLARHRRARGDEVRLQTGTDDNALKNVLAAEAAGCPWELAKAARAVMLPRERLPRRAWHLWGRMRPISAKTGGGSRQRGERRAFEQPR